MKNLEKLIKETKEYTAAYIKKYSLTDKDLIEAIFVSHLAYLLNQKGE